MNNLCHKESKKHTVLFVDIGHSKVEIFISDIMKHDQANILYSVSDRNLGVRDIDMSFCKYAAYIFSK